MAEWSAALVSSLPDSAFACIDAGGEKDEQGKTVPRSLRHYPHHDKSGKVDLPHLRNALARVRQDATSSCGRDHLEEHARVLEIGGRERQMTRALQPLIGPERRFVAFEADPADAEGDGDRLLFRGHAAVFGKRAYIGRKPYGFWETVRSGAFAKVISDGDVRLMHNHDPNLVLARSTVKEGPGSLHLEERKKGLHVEAEWVPTSYARDLHALVRSGVINGMSFSFLPVKDDWTSNQEGEETRELLELQVPDVSTVTFPAYSETDAAVRSAGLGLLMDATDLSDEQRLRIVQAVRQGVVTPDLVPALRAASRALVELTERYEPALATRADADDEADVRTEQIFLRARALMALAGDYTKGARVR